MLYAFEKRELGSAREFDVDEGSHTGFAPCFAEGRGSPFRHAVHTIGVISPSGHEVGPFLSIEQVALSHVVPARSRTEVFAWYTLAGSLTTALGAFCGGAAAGLVHKASLSISDSYRVVVLLFERAP